MVSIIVIEVIIVAVVSVVMVRASSFMKRLYSTAPANATLQDGHGCDPSMYDVL